jgi:hypothetical protein
MKLFELELVAVVPIRITALDSSEFESETPTCEHIYGVRCRCTRVLEE